MSPGLQRGIVAVTTMMATILVILDVTIANVALDHMRGTLSAGVDEITWVLDRTSSSSITPHSSSPMPSACPSPDG
jgi:hypothetical protein